MTEENYPKTPFILPTLQSNFNYAINEILKRMNTVDIAETWRAIETLYTILPPPIFVKVEREYKDIVKQVNNATNGSSIDFLEMVEANHEARMILEELAIPFFRRMYEQLYNGGYLERGELQPRFRKEKKLSVLEP